MNREVGIALVSVLEALHEMVNILADSSSGYMVGSRSDIEWNEKKNAVLLKVRAIVERIKVDDDE